MNMNESENIDNTQPDEEEFDPTKLIKLATIFLEKGGFDKWLSNSKDTTKLNFDRTKLILSWSIVASLIVFGALAIMTWYDKINAEWFSSLISVFLGVSLTVLSSLIPSRKQ